MDKQISEYIANQDIQQQKILLKIRDVIKKLLPSAEERMSYGVPSFRQNSKSILYAAFKQHVGIYPEPEIVEYFKNELERYETAKGTIKFKLSEPIPYTLIEKNCHL
jgi:uncharacterized protein YdhG (YjbR/CyaY superfamily)